MPQPRDLGLEHPLELLARLVFDPSVGQNARTMNHTARRSPFAVHLRDQRPERRLIAHVHRVICERHTRRAELCQDHRHFALSQHLFELGVDRARHCSDRSAGDQRLLDLRFSRQSREPVGFEIRFGTATDDRQTRLPGAGDRQRRCRRHAPRSATDDDQLARPHRGRTTEGVGQSFFKHGRCTGALRRQTDFDRPDSQQFIDQHMRRFTRRRPAVGKVERFAGQLGPLARRRFRQPRETA